MAILVAIFLKFRLAESVLLLSLIHLRCFKLVLDAFIVESCQVILSMHALDVGGFSTSQILSNI